MQGRFERGTADERSQSEANISPAAAKSLRPLAAATLLVILLAGLGLRLYRLTWQSVWDNEAFSLTVSHLPFHEMTAKIVKDIVHPPLHYYLLHGVFREFGFGDFQARLVSAVFGTITVGVVFLMAQYLFDTSTGLLAAMLMAVSQLGIMYSQEARPYAMAGCFSACAIYCFCIAWRERRWLAWCGFIGFAILMLYTQYFTGLVLACLFFYSVFQRKHFGIPALWWLVAGIAVVIAFAPWLTTGIIESALRSPKTSFKSQPFWFAVDRLTYIRDLNAFNNGNVDNLVTLRSFRRSCLVAGWLLFSMPALLALRPLVSRGAAPTGRFPGGQSLALLAILWIAPHLVLIAMGLLGMQYHVRYALFCMVPYYVLAARGITTFPVPAARAVWVIGIILYSSFALRANYFRPYKENYRDALLHLASAQQPGDCMVIFPNNIDLPIREWTVYLSSRTPPRVISPDVIESGAGDCGRVWFVAWQVFPEDADQLHQIERKLPTFFTKTEDRHYFWVSTTLFARPSHPATF